MYLTAPLQTALNRARGHDPLARIKALAELTSLAQTARNTAIIDAATHPTHPTPVATIAREINLTRQSVYNILNATPTKEVAR